MPMVGEVQTVHRTLGVPWWSELAMGRRASLDDRRAAAESVSGKAKGSCLLDGFDGSEFARRARACGVFSQRRIRRGVHTDGSDRDVGIYTICFCHLWFGLFGRFPLVASRRLNSRRSRRRVILGIGLCATQDSVGRRSAREHRPRGLVRNTHPENTGAAVRLPAGVPQSRPGIALRCCWKLL